MYFFGKLGLNAKLIAHALIFIFLVIMCNHAIASASCVIENDMQISLKSHHGNYVAEEKNDGKLIANLTWLRTWEKFTVITHDTG